VALRELLPKAVPVKPPRLLGRDVVFPDCNRHGNKLGLDMLHSTLLATAEDNAVIVVPAEACVTAGEAVAVVATDFLFWSCWAASLQEESAPVLDWRAL
jgi:hypothetical protein